MDLLIFTITQLLFILILLFQFKLKFNVLLVESILIEFKNIFVK